MHLFCVFFSINKIISFFTQNRSEKRDIPFLISACIREVERRGMNEVGIYRVSGSALDVAKLKKSFETSNRRKIFSKKNFNFSIKTHFLDNYEAEQLLKEVDMHSVTGILKLYLRELPEALFTDLLYPKLFEVFNRFSHLSESTRINALLGIFEELPLPNKASINYILDRLIR